MFSSSGGQNCIIQPLVSSQLSLNLCTGRPLTEYNAVLTDRNSHCNLFTVVFDSRNIGRIMDAVFGLLMSRKGSITW